jgi:hypothetical protein
VYEVAFTYENYVISKVVVYKRRWYLLTLFSIFSMLSCAIWNTWGPIATSASSVCHFSKWDSLTKPGDPSQPRHRRYATFPNGIVSQNLGTHRDIGIVGMPFFHKGLVSHNLGTQRNFGILGMPLSYKGLVSQNLGTHRNLRIFGMPLSHKGLVSQNLGTHRQSCESGRQTFSSISGPRFS